MRKNDGGSAFPVSAIDAAEPGSLDEMKRLAQGMSLRDYFAAKIMASLIQSAKGENLLGAPYPENNRNFAMAAYAISDAMLMEREK